MEVETTKVFKSGGSQAVRIPASMRFPDDVDEVIIVRNRDDSITIRSRRKNLLGFFEKYKDVPRPEGPFLEDRERIPPEDREMF